MKILRVLVAAVALSAATIQPAVAQSRQDQQMAASLLMIQEQQQQTALAVAQLTEIVKAMNPRFDEVVEATRKRLADLELTIKQQGNDIGAIRASSQETGTRIGSLSDEIEALRKTVDTLTQAVVQLQRMQVAPPVIDPNAPPGQTSQEPGLPGATPAPPTSTAFITPGAVGMSPARVLAEAKGDYFAGRYSLAITGFEAVIKDFPTTQAAEEAQLYIGDSHRAESRWTEAIAAYDTLVKTYPKSQWVPDAYYRRGLAQSSAGQTEAARLSHEFAARNYPDTEAGRMARQRLPSTWRP